MSSFNPRRLSTAAILALSVALGACGFEPLYGVRNSDMPAELAQVRVDVIADRSGQFLRNLLIDRLNPYGRPDRPLYALEIALDEEREKLSIRKDEIATRANYVVIAQYRLREAGTGRELTRGRARSTNSFNIGQSEFATLSGEADARNRALREIGDEIKIRLGIYFSARGA